MPAKSRRSGKTGLSTMAQLRHCTDSAVENILSYLVELKGLKRECGKNNLCWLPMRCGEVELEKKLTAVALAG